MEKGDSLGSHSLDKQECEVPQFSHLEDLTSALISLSCVSLKHTERRNGLNKQQSPKKILNTKPGDRENIHAAMKKGSNQPIQHQKQTDFQNSENSNWIEHQHHLPDALQLPLRDLSQLAG